jgi:hypothetical protein
MHDNTYHGTSFLFKNADRGSSLLQSPVDNKARGSPPGVGGGCVFLIRSLSMSPSIELRRSNHRTAIGEILASIFGDVTIRYGGVVENNVRRLLPKSGGSTRRLG